MCSDIKNFWKELRYAKKNKSTYRFVADYVQADKESTAMSAYLRERFGASDICLSVERVDYFPINVQGGNLVRFVNPS